MTIAAGFPCAEGLVLCADTQETIAGYVKTDTEKMTVIRFPHYNLAITGAGDGDLIEMLTQEIHDALTRENPNPSVWPILAVLKKTALTVFNEHIIPYASVSYEERPIAELLIGLQLQSGTLLYKARETIFRRLQTPECIGIGLALGKSLIDRLYSPTMSLAHTGLVALYTLRQAKRWVDGCGGNSDVILLSNNDCKITHFPTSEVKKLEDHFDEFDKAIKPVLISCADATTDHKAFDQVMRTFSMDMLSLRGKFMEFEEFARRLCELSGIAYSKPNIKDLENTLTRMLAGPS